MYQEYFSSWMWLVFAGLVMAMLAIDLLADKGKNKVMDFKSSLRWSLVWVGVSLSFGGFLWLYLRAHFGIEVANTAEQGQALGF